MWMRRWLAIALVACDAGARPPTPVPPPPPQPVPVVIDAPPGLIELEATLTVSSQVKNPRILPQHLVDHDMKTAWNSRTGQLVGSWIDITVPKNARIHELRLTVGHTGRGPRGEDYFTMNPRIHKVSVLADGEPAGTFALDIDKRDLQTFAVHAQHTVRIEVEAIEPGSKPNWREVSISELEVWGPPPAGWKPTTQSRLVTVDVYKPMRADPCHDIEKRREQFMRDHKAEFAAGSHPDHNYPPTCGTIDIPSTAAALDPAFRRAAASCEAGDEIYGPTTCTLAFEHRGQVATIDLEHQSARATMTITGFEEQDVIAGGAKELVVRIDGPDGQGLAVCRPKPLACTDFFLVAGSDWKTREQFRNGELVLDVVKGDPPSGVAGKHPLKFSH